MPTSSQALILQTSAGDLPPLFQRRIWQPDQSFRHLPFTANQTKRVGHVTDKRHTPVLIPLRRSGSEPNLERRKYNFSTLQQLLQIRQLGAMSTYDNKTDFYTMSMRPRELAPIRRQHYMEDWQDGKKKASQRLFIPEFKRSNDRRKKVIKVENEELLYTQTEDIDKEVEDVGTTIINRAELSNGNILTDTDMINGNGNHAELHVTNEESETRYNQLKYNNFQMAPNGHTSLESQIQNGGVNSLKAQVQKDLNRVRNTQTTLVQHASPSPKKRSDTQLSNGLEPERNRRLSTHLQINDQSPTESHHIKHKTTCGHMENDDKPILFMKTKMDGSVFTLEATSGDNADYFQLFETQPDPNQPVASTHFRLVASSSTEPGSFQISPVDSENLDNFRLIPPDGYDSDDGYRLQAVPGSPNTFTLLQRDPRDNHVFKNVTTDWSDSVMAGNNKHYHNRQHNNETAVRDERIMLLKRSKTVPGKGKSMIDELGNECGENMTGTFNSEQSAKRTETSPNGTATSPIDSDWYNYIMKSALHHPNDVLLESDEGMQFLQTQDQRDESKKNQEFMGSIRNQSVDVYERLVNLGFRRANEDPDKVSFYENIRSRTEKERQKYFSSDWKTDNADQRSRVMEHLGMSGSAYSSLDNSSLMLKQLLLGQPLDETKLDLDNAAWKTKKKIKALRMRKEPPPKDPNAVCICLQDNAIPHVELKRKLEREIGVKVASLQFDPVSVHCADPEVKSQWIVRLPNRIICEYLTKCGIDLDGVHYSVKSFDDVMQKEHNAYRFYTAYTGMQVRKGNGQKAKRAKQSHPSETQTGTLPPLTQVAVL